MRHSYKHIQQGQTPHINLTQDQIERLEDIGFKWGHAVETFEQRCSGLKAFKSEFGHCNVPNKYSTDPSLGELVRYDEIHLQQDAARTETKEQSHSRTDKASGRDWFQMESQEDN